MRILSLPVLALPALLYLGCVEGRSPVAPEPLDPAPPVGASVAEGEPLSVTGCAIFTVDVSDPARVTVEESADPGCERARPVVEGEATFDATTRVLRIPVAIENGGHSPLEVPASLTSTDNLLEVIGGASVGEGGLLVFLNADSTEVTVADGEDVVRYIWRYDDPFPDLALGPGERSGSRPIEIAVDPSVETLRVEMDGHAMIPPEWVVPSVAPDTVPPGFYEEADFRRGSACITGKMLRGIVVVRFEPGTPQSERQEAIDLIDGRVVGGVNSRKDTEGWYYVQVEDDPEGQILCDAIETLNALPQVGYAREELFASALYRRPDEEGEWTGDGWRVDPASVAFSQRWGLEAIAAPLAWGCSVGDTLTPVAVVDRGFQVEVTDLMANVAPEWRDDVGVNNTTDHATKVASVLAARGDNGGGITGTMWRADLRPYDVDVVNGQVSQDTTGAGALTRIVDMVEVAAGDGARVINLALGIGWQEGWGRLPGTVADSLDWDLRQVERWRTELREVLRQIPEAPLLVLAAGNDSVDASWAGFPEVVLDLPDRVLVVAASAVTQDLTVGSNRNKEKSLVEVTAPGGTITTLDGVGSPDTVSGTSYAAPYVSGVAGLLASFDPVLTAPEIKQLILDGAAEGGRSAGGIPLLNAYESLRAAAERSGAPLCGQQVWAEGGMLWARRNGSPVELAAAADTAAQVEVLHGGKFVLHITQEGGQLVGRVVSWDPESRTWESAGLPSDWHDLRGGTLRSVFGRSHDRDTLARVDDSVVNGSRWYETADSAEAPVWVQEEGAPQSTRGHLAVADLPDPLQVTCLERDRDSGSCLLTVTESRAWLFRLGYPQFPSPVQTERQAYLTVGPMQVVRHDTTAAWEPCSFDSSHDCRRVQFLQDQTEALTYRMDLAAGDATPLPVPVDPTIPEESVFWIGQGENGEEVVLMRGRWRITRWADPALFHETGSPFEPPVEELERCFIEYRKRADFSPLEPPIPVAEGCDFGSLNGPSTGAGVGTISPSVVPRRGAGGQSGSSREAVDVPLPILTSGTRSGR